MTVRGWEPKNLGPNALARWRRNKEEREERESRPPCPHPEHLLERSTGLMNEFFYCGGCGHSWNKPIPVGAALLVRDIVKTPDENRGSSTDQSEATLRQIGRECFGITYPEDERA